MGGGIEGVPPAKYHQRYQKASISMLPSVILHSIEWFLCDVGLVDLEKAKIDFN
jgi:hypothetical protein